MDKRDFRQYFIVAGVPDSADAAVLVPRLLEAAKDYKELVQARSGQRRPNALQWKTLHLTP